MNYSDLRDFIAKLQEKGDFKRVSAPISPNLEMTEVCDRILRAGGPALLFDNPVDAAGKRYPIPVLANLFGTPRRVALGMGADDVGELRKIGHVLARLKEPEPPKGLRDIMGLGSLVKAVWDMAPKEVKGAPARKWCGKAMTSTWPPADPALLAGRCRAADHLGPGDHEGAEQEAAEPRHLPPAGAGPQQGHHALAGPPRRRAGFPRAWHRQPGQAVSGGSGAGRRPGHHPGRGDAGAGQPVRIPVRRPAARQPHRADQGHRQRTAGAGFGRDRAGRAYLSGRSHPSGFEHALEGPYGDHTGYYNEQDMFPVFTIDRITMRRDPIYHSTYTGKPPDEPAMLGVALNEVFIPLLQKQFSEITDFYLPPEGCSYRMAVVQMKKQPMQGMPSG
jgi:4-hydroxy-3-polyprenylbenzoate decarboxylase